MRCCAFCLSLAPTISWTSQGSYDDELSLLAPETSAPTTQSLRARQLGIDIGIIARVFSRGTRLLARIMRGSLPWSYYGFPSFPECAHRLPDPTTASTPCTAATITTMIDRHVNSSSGCRISTSSCTLCSCLFIATTRNAAVDLLIPHRSSPYPSTLRLPSSPPFPSCGPSRPASSSFAFPSTTRTRRSSAQVAYDGPSDGHTHTYLSICAPPRPSHPS
ncbi:hypothetical protein GALMADRAFT_1209777 [Galerina marginata CBS 339.88]|uniref:Uncharacterized protein n=1 Tax=Galerina marginata (strain CBS 339.88) TaxID=685588 RepID=A0A067S5R3_GALM3|nr:hypothetical protein GALMADRAFT_1209777 [Galerina marginata CBS 339.88]